MNGYLRLLQNETFIHRASDEAIDLPIRAERTDKQLVDLVMAGDATAFEQLFDRHKRLVAVVASRYFRRTEEVEEIIQITFAKAYCELAGFRGKHDQSLASWLVRIASNSSLDTLRSQSRKPERLNCDLSEAEVDSLLELTAVDGRDAENSVIDRELTEKLLSSIRADDRALLEMLYAHEMSVADIAETLGWSQSNVKVRAWRARAALRKVLRKFL